MKPQAVKKKTRKDVVGTFPSKHYTGAKLAQTLAEADTFINLPPQFNQNFEATYFDDTLTIETKFKNQIPGAAPPDPFYQVKFWTDEELMAPNDFDPQAYLPAIDKKKDLKSIYSVFQTTFPTKGHISPHPSSISGVTTAST